MTEYRDLPKEYIQLEYIQSSGTQYIKTEFKPNQNTDMEIEFEALTNNNAIAATNTGWGKMSYGVWIDAYGYENQMHEGINLSGSRMTIKIENGIFYKNGIEDWNAGANKVFQTNHQLYLCANDNKGNAAAYCKAKLYSCKIWDTDTLIRDYVPCIRKSDNAIGVYDVVNKTFSVNSGTGTFTAGEEVMKPSATAYIGAPGSVQLTENNVDTYFSSVAYDPLNGAYFNDSTIKMLVNLDDVTKSSVTLISKEDATISFDYYYYNEGGVLPNHPIDFYINSVNVNTFSNDSISFKWSGKILKGSSLKLYMEINTSITDEVSLNAVKKPTVRHWIVISNIQVSTPSMPAVARKITNAYVGAPSSVQLIESNVGTYFDTSNQGMYSYWGNGAFHWYLTSGDSWVAKEDTYISFNYDVKNNATTIVYNFYINSEFICIFGDSDHISTGKWSGYLSKGDILSLTADKNTDITGDVISTRAPERGATCTLTNIQISTPSMPSVARKIKKAYVGVPVQIKEYAETKIVEDTRNLYLDTNSSNIPFDSNGRMVLEGGAISGNQGRCLILPSSNLSDEYNNCKWWIEVYNPEQINFTISDVQYLHYCYSGSDENVKIAMHEQPKDYFSFSNNTSTRVLIENNSIHPIYISIYLELPTGKTIMTSKARLCYEAPLQIPTDLESISWAQLHEAANTFTHDELAHLIGMTKNVTVNGKVTPFQLIGIGQDEAVDGTDVLMTFQCKDCLPDTYIMHPSAYNNWGSCKMRTYLHDKILNQFDTDTKAAIVPVKKKYTINRNGNMLTSNDTLWLASEWEIFGSTSFGTADEGNFYEYWSKNNNSTARIKKRYGSADAWWERSIFSSTNFCVVYKNGDAGDYNYSMYCGVVPCFCI